MQMQQLIKSARRATPRTLIASQQKKWTLRKPLISRCGWIEEKKKDRARSDRQPSRRRNSKLSSTISGDVNKMKVRHGLISLGCLLIWQRHAKSPANASNSAGGGLSLPRDRRGILRLAGGGQLGAFAFGPGLSAVAFRGPDYIYSLQ